MLRETNRQRVVLVGHSQGGLDARYLVSTLRYGDRVALLATIATPHRGTRVADAVLDRVPNIFDGFLDAVTSVFGFAYNEVRSNADLRQTLQSLSEANAEEFNRQNPDDPRVVYWSWTGRSNRRNGELQCSGARFPNEPSRLDDINPLLLPFSRILEQNDPTLHVNDGMVEVASARWGQFMGCIPADHFDEVGQIARNGPVPGKRLRPSGVLPLRGRASPYRWLLISMSSIQRFLTFSRSGNARSVRSANTRRAHKFCYERSTHTNARAHPRSPRVSLSYARLRPERITRIEMPTAEQGPLAGLPAAIPTPTSTFADGSVLELPDRVVRRAHRASGAARVAKSHGTRRRRTHPLPRP